MSRRECLAKCSKKSEALVEGEVAEAIASCGGDVRAALRATLIANAYLEGEIENGLRAGPDAQGTSTNHEDLEAA